LGTKFAGAVPLDHLEGLKKVEQHTAQQQPNEMKEPTLSDFQYRDRLSWARQGRRKRVTTVSGTEAIASRNTHVVFHSALGEPEPLHAVSCSSGYPQESLLLRYNNITDHAPLFGDLLLAEDRVYAVINLRDVARRDGWRSKIKPRPAWHAALWTFERGTDVVRCATFGKDPHRHTLILHVGQSELGINGSRVNHITIRGVLGRTERVFENVPLCPPPPTKRPPAFLTACTSTLSGSELDRLPEWIAYNRVQGMEHSYVYVNDDFAKAKAALQPFVDAGLATLVNWTPSPQHAGSFLYQMAQQNSCLLRARGRAHWVALHDSDEFFYAVKPWESVDHMLRELVRGDKVDRSIGAVQARTWFHGLNRDDSRPADSASPHLLLARYSARDKRPIRFGREKLIVRPENVQYVSVHVVTLGNWTRTLHARKEMRLVHFKDIGNKRYNVNDTAMREWVKPVQHVIDRVMSGDW
jgi:hypothetical protein